MVDAALVGFDQDEVVTVPALADVAQWDVFETARLAMSDHLSSANPADRYSRKPSRELDHAL